MAMWPSCRPWLQRCARSPNGNVSGQIHTARNTGCLLYAARAYAMPPFMWSLGTIIGAAMGGYLAQPARYYPSLFSPDGLFGKYPYLLPNLVAVAFILVAIIQGYFFLEETNPGFPSRSLQDQNADSGPANEYTPLQPNPRRNSVTEILSTGARRPSFISGSMPTM